MVSTKCQCGKARRKGGRYCKACHARSQREYRRRIMQALLLLFHAEQSRKL